MKRDGSLPLQLELHRHGGQVDVCHRDIHIVHLPDHLIHLHTPAHVLPGHRELAGPVAGVDRNDVLRLRVKPNQVHGGHGQLLNVPIRLNAFAQLHAGQQGQMVVQGGPIIQHIYIIAPALTQINRLSSRIKQGGQRPVHSAESTEKVFIDILGHIQHRPLGCGEVGQNQDGVTVHQYLGDMEGSTVVLRGNVYGLGAGGKQLLGLLTAAQKVDQSLINADHHRCRTGDEHQCRFGTPSYTAADKYRRFPLGSTSPLPPVPWLYLLNYRGRHFVAGH